MCGTFPAPLEVGLSDDPEVLELPIELDGVVTNAANGGAAAAATLSVKFVAAYAVLNCFAAAALSEAGALSAAEWVEWVADREAVDRGELAGARAEGHRLEAVSDGRTEAIHDH